MKTVNESGMGYVSPLLEWIDGLCVEGVLCASSETFTEEWDVVDLTKGGTRKF